MKKTIIMIHGFRGTHDGLSLIAKNMHNASVLIPDLPGFAEGDMLHDYSLEAYVEWLHGYVLSQKLGHPPMLLGHSFGSIICAAYAAKYGNTIDRLILVNPIGAPALKGPRRLLTKLAIFYYWLGKHLPKHIARAWLSSRSSVDIMSAVMTKTDDAQLRAFIRQQHREHFSTFHSPKSVYQGFITSVSHTVQENAPDITNKTLLVAGSLDDITPLEKQKELVTLFSDSTLKVIEGAGHLTHYEAPEKVAALTQAFIKS